MIFSSFYFNSRTILNVITPFDYYLIIKEMYAYFKEFVIIIQFILNQYKNHLNSLYQVNYCNNHDLN